jgi:cellulose synthase (UDP-forming)
MTQFSKFIHTVLTTASLGVVFLFGVFWFSPNHLPTNPWNIFWLDLTLFLLVSYIIWHPIVMAIFTWVITSHIKKVDSPEPNEGYKVAFLTSFVPASEDISLLHKCLPSMVAADYPHDTWLLDEGDDPRAKEICKQYGVKHFSRANLAHYNTEAGKFKAKTKGGNHNSWHDTHGHDYDIVAQMDTDFVAQKDFLTKTLGFFNDPEIGFVGTPQVYGNTEESLIARGAAEQTYGFYGPVLRGMAGMQMNTLIGANHLLRTKALDDVDHYSAHITEDLLTGMKLHAKGWKSAYVPEALLIGEGPTDWQSYLNQQMRWAFGCMDILFFHAPLLFKSMKPRQILYYFWLQQHYFAGLASIVGMIGLIAYFGYQVNVSSTDITLFLIYYLPVLAVIELMNLWIQRFHIQPEKERGLLFSSRLIHIAAWPIFFLALIGVIRRSNLSYKVTPKGKNQAVNYNSFELFHPHFLLAFVNFSALILMLITGQDGYIMVFWAIVGTLTLVTIPFVQPIGAALARLSDELNRRIVLVSSLAARTQTLRRRSFNLVSTVALIVLFVTGQAFLIQAYQNDVEIPTQVGVTPVVDELIQQEFGPREEPILELADAPTSDTVSLDEDEIVTPEPIVVIAQKRDGLTHIARKAVAAYSEREGILLAPEEKIFAETQLKNSLAIYPLHTGREVIFEEETLATTFEEAQNLGPIQRQGWSQYVVVR